ncbi:hypothetical protein [Vibrio europaeus]|uniref:hypothetical protein n=1 Tax=Vibrio europaeus TaxID=300876 RepID=UPI00148E1D92|nr:hypothetical protein [Vibrio europaeus]NOH26416.1 hypothetical protein [Vibrio europaeus]
MSDDKKITTFILFSFPFCLGLIIGLIFFNPSDVFIKWWVSIDWKSQGVANVGAWVAGIATSLAALATASAARSSAKAADAATKSINQWKLHASYDKYIDTGVKARIKLRWLEAHLKNMCEKRFQVFFEQGSGIVVDSSSNDVDSFIFCLAPNFVYTDPKEVNRFNKFKDDLKYQSDAINGLYPTAIDLVEETYELSKNHVGLNKTEKDAILKTIEEFIGQIRVIANLYYGIFESPNNSDRAKKTQIDSCLNCRGATQHYYRSTLSNLQLITGYIDNLVIDLNMESWDTVKSKHVLEEQAIFSLISDAEGDPLDRVLNSIAQKFGRL